MTDYLLLIVSAALVNNFVLVKFLGLCPFIGTSNKIDSAIGMAWATAFVLTLAAVLSYLVHHFLLVPYHLEHLRTLMFILVIATSVQLTELMVRTTAPLLHRLLGIFLPLITTNCAVLGVALLNVQQSQSLLQAALFGLGAALGFGLVLIAFSALRERVTAADVPTAFQGPAIALVSAALMALAFMGFTGLGRL